MSIGILDACHLYQTRSNLETIQIFTEPQSEIRVLFIPFFEVFQISQQSHSQSGFMKGRYTNTCLNTAAHWFIYNSIEKGKCTIQCRLAWNNSQILHKLLPSTKLSLPGVQLISGLGIESRLFGHNWNAGHNYDPLLTHCDIVPDCGTISQLHKHTLVCFCYYHSLPKTQMSALITDCPGLTFTLCPSLRPFGALST